MKRLAKIICLMSVFLMVAASAALANTINSGDTITLTGYNTDDLAGIMTYSVTDKTEGTFTYNTFCIQNTTYISESTPYNIVNITNNVGNTKATGTLNGTPLSGAVNYLFYLYSVGTFNSSFSGTSSAALLNQADFQQLLWYAQGEYSIANIGTTEKAWSDTTPVTVNLDDQTAWYADYENYINNVNGLQNKSYGTEVLNIVDCNGTDVQNQLYNPATPVPEPSTFLLVGAGLLGILFRRPRS